MPKALHELRDPIHNFVRVEAPERAVLDSRPFQRLRHIHQLAMAYLVYPGATHKRFEHSLGVMELAGRVFDVVTNPNNATDASREVMPGNATDLGRWRRTVRMAALVHDIGHLPFSHAAEDMLPPEWDHERLTDSLALSEEMRPIWRDLGVAPEHVSKLAVGPKKLKHRNETFSPWEAILTEIITGDAFGVDRMDYLLRDAYHSGVAYGKFDHYRLIDTLRIIGSPTDDAPTLGVEAGGIHSAEALLLARYFMYSQVYFHPVRRAYDFHLSKFLQDWLEGGRFSVDQEQHLARTDIEVLAAIRHAARTPGAPGHEHARRIEQRRHFRLLYSRNPNDHQINTNAAAAVKRAAEDRYGIENVHSFTYLDRSRAFDFPVLYSDNRVAASSVASAVLAAVPPVSVNYVFIAPELKADADKWLERTRPSVIVPQQEGGT